jgi:hypothetical protein
MSYFHARKKDEVLVNKFFRKNMKPVNYMGRFITHLETSLVTQETDYDLRFYLSIYLLI